LFAKSQTQQMENLINLLKTGRIQEVIDLLLRNLKEDADTENMLVLLSARYATNLRNQQLGLIDRKDSDLATNQIVNSLLQLIRELPEDLQVPEIPLSPVATSTEKFVNILFFASNPPGTMRLNLDIESRELSQIFRNHPRKDQFRVQKEFAATLRLFMQVVNEEAATIIHFAFFANEEGLVFHDDDDKPKWVLNDTLLNIFDMIRVQPECVFFNTFISQSLADGLAKKIPFVIGMNGLIDDNAAITFSTGFYQAIAFGKDYPSAFKLGRELMIVEGFEKEKDKPFLVGG
jgi:hypothetical protein